MKNYERKVVIKSYGKRLDKAYKVGVAGLLVVPLGGLIAITGAFLDNNVAIILIGLAIATMGPIFALISVIIEKGR